MTSVNSAEMFQFVETQPAVVAALKNHQERYTELSMADRDVIQEARKVQCLLLAFESCINKQYNHEDVSESDEKLLKYYTSNDSESWFWTFNTAQELIQESIVRQCAKVCEAEEKHAKLKKDHRLCKELSNARETARKQYKAMQKQEAN